MKKKILFATSLFSFLAFGVTNLTASGYTDTLTCEQILSQIRFCKVAGPYCPPGRLLELEQAAEERDCCATNPN